MSNASREYTTEPEESLQALSLFAVAFNGPSRRRRTPACLYVPASIQQG
jgi:hypothetical protein